MRFSLVISSISRIGLNHVCDYSHEFTLSGKAEVRRQKAEGLCRRASGDRREQGFKTPTKFILVACNW